jgi:hypothetical protein
VKGTAGGNSELRRCAASALSARPVKADVRTVDIARRQVQVHAERLARSLDISGQHDLGQFRVGTMLSR